MKGRKELLGMIIRVKIKGNGRPRSNRGANIIDSDSGDNSHSTTKKPNSNVVSGPEAISGIAVILEAIKTKERKETGTNAETSVPAVPSSNSNVMHDVADTNSSSSNSTIPSTIDVAKNSYGLSWRQPPSESYSDWTIEVLDEDITDRQNNEGSALNHVHRRVLAVGPKKSDFFAKIFKVNSSINRNQLRFNKRQAAVFPIALDYIYTDIDLDLDTEKAYAVSSRVHIETKDG